MSPEEIKELRQRKNMTQKQLSELCGVRRSTVTRWENGLRAPSGSALAHLEQVAKGKKVIPTSLARSEQALLDKNVKAGGFKSRQQFLKSALKHLKLHGEFSE